MITLDAVLGLPVEMLLEKENEPAGPRAEQARRETASPDS